MITQQHEKKVQQQAQASNVVNEPLWRVIVFSILGIVLPMAAGSMIWWPWGVPNFFDSQWVLNLIILAAFMSVAVGAFLLCFAFRVWWASVRKKESQPTIGNRL